MSQRLDLVVFGATGYTGEYVVKELIRITKSYPELTWGIAGRSRNKLTSCLLDLSRKTGDDLSQVRIITADVENNDSLKKMCSQTKVLVNCCGPFVKYGEQVVAAAVSAKTHYTDVSAEACFFELIKEKYDTAAREAGVFVITSCGLISLPADLGVLLLEQNFGGTLNSVESYLSGYFPPKFLKFFHEPSCRYSTWESAINNLSNLSLNRIIEKPFHLEPEVKDRYFFRNFDKWCIPFPGVEKCMIQHTQRHLLSSANKRPVQYKAYMTVSSLFLALAIFFGSILFLILCKISFTKKMLLKYPKLFSFGRVTSLELRKGVLDDLSFQYVMMGTGWDVGTDLKQKPNKKLVARIRTTGVNPAYIGTSVVLLFAALTILKESEKMPSTTGVMTPGVAFRHTNIIRHLNKNNIEFDIISTN